MALQSAEDRRLELDTLLRSVSGLSNVYFQPPTSVKMKYPCIRYERSAAVTRFADNAPYRFKKRYTITVIDRNPDSEIPNKIAVLPMCSYDRHYKADDLNHDVFTIYY